MVVTPNSYPNAFLHDFITKDVFISQPKGFVRPQHIMFANTLEYVMGLSKPHKGTTD